jgi:hypothetical protein
MAAAFVRYWVQLHISPQEGDAQAISDDLLGVTEVM